MSGRKGRKRQAARPAKRRGAPLVPLAAVVLLVAGALHLQRAGVPLPGLLEGDTGTYSGSGVPAHPPAAPPNAAATGGAAAEQADRGSPRILLPESSSYRSPLNDPRWSQAEEEAAAGRERIRAAEEWRVNVGGDPFYYRSELNEGRKHYAAAALTLQSMRADFLESPSALTVIDRKIEQYERAAGGPVK